MFKTIIQTVSVYLFTVLWIFITSVGDMVVGERDFLHTMLCTFTVLSFINLIKKMQLKGSCLLNIYFEHTKGVCEGPLSP